MHELNMAPARVQQHAAVLEPGHMLPHLSGVSRFVGICLLMSLLLTSNVATAFNHPALPQLLLLPGHHDGRVAHHGPGHGAAVLQPELVHRQTPLAPPTRAQPLTRRAPSAS